MNDATKDAAFSVKGSVPPGNSALDLDAPSFLERLPVAVYACDAKGRLVWFNRKAAELWGRSPSIGDDADLYCGTYKAYTTAGEPLPLGEAPMASVLRTGQPLRDREVVIERPDGRRFSILANVDPLFDSRGAVAGGVNCFQDITELKRAKAELREGEQRFGQLLEALPTAIYTTDRHGRLTYYNKAAIALWGQAPDLGTQYWCGSWRLYHPDGRAMAHDQCPMAQALKEGRPIRGAEALVERPDGSRVPAIPFPTPLHDATGALIGGVNMMVDITERKEAEARQSVLHDELNHRVKNTLAIVQALASQTIRGNGVPEEVLAIFESRLGALSKVHDQFARAGWEVADLRSIIDDISAPYCKDGERVKLSGEAVKLAPRAALMLAMVLHEFITNAAKYGALSVPGGAVTVSWKVVANGGPHLSLDWREAGGPPVQRPAWRGFGSRLMERGITQDLKGSAQVFFDPAGLRCTLDIPLSDSTG
jgi:PAS domain S-box-containing protein